MKNSTKLLSLGLGLMMVGSSAAYALSSDSSTVSVSQVLPNQEFFDALESKDFSAYSTLYTEKTGDALTQESFNKILELHNLRTQEKTVRDELDTLGVKMPGFGNGNGEGMGRGGKMGGMMHEDLTDEERVVMQNSMQLLRSGDKDAAEKLLSDAGIEVPQRFENQKGGRSMGNTNINK